MEKTNEEKRKQTRKRIIKTIILLLIILIIVLFTKLEVVLNGDEKVFLSIGEQYEEQGARLDLKFFDIKLFSFKKRNNNW